MAVSVVDYEFLGRINSRRPSLQESCLSIVPGLWERKLPDHPVDDSFFAADSIQPLRDMRQLDVPRPYAYSVSA